jgi:tetratricopeptide (TPR) repeat protein
LIPFIYGRPGLEAKLHQRKAYLFRTDEDVANAVKEYDKAIRLLTSLHIDVDQQRIKSIVDVADTLYLAGDKDKAEAFYLEALSYDWTKVQDAEVRQRLYDLYLTAGRGLIEVRKGNLKALKEIFFISAAKGELGSELQKAIRQAGGSEQEVAAVMAGYK